MSLKLSSIFSRVAPDRRFEPVFAAVGGMGGACAAHLDMPQAVAIGALCGAAYAVMQYSLGSPRKP